MGLLMTKQKDFTIDVKLSAESSQTLVNDIIGSTTNKNALRYMAVDALTQYFNNGGTIAALNKLIRGYGNDFKIVEDRTPHKERSCTASAPIERKITNY